MQTRPVVYEWKVTFRGKLCGQRHGKFQRQVEYVNAGCSGSAVGQLLCQYIIHGEPKVERLGEVEVEAEAG